MSIAVEQPGDLGSDDAALWVVKDERVEVVFAAADGSLVSEVGLNRYAAHDALLTGSTGDRWSVSRARFDAKYRPDAATPKDAPGVYRNVPTRLRAKCMDHDFSVERCAGGDVLHGKAGDWLIQYAPGDFGIVARARFESVYRTAQCL